MYIHVAQNIVSNSKVCLRLTQLNPSTTVHRSLDVPPAREIERLQAVRFVRQVCACVRVCLYVNIVILNTHAQLCNYAYLFTLSY